MLRYSVEVTTIDRIRNEYLQEATPDGKIKDKSVGGKVEMISACTERKQLCWQKNDRNEIIKYKEKQKAIKVCGCSER